MMPRLSAEIRRRLRSGSDSTRTSGRTAADARIAPSASAAAKRSSLRSSARNGTTLSTDLGVPDLPQRAQGHEPHAGIGVVEQRGEVARGLRLLQLAEGLHGLLAHQRRLVHEGGAQQVGHARGVDLPQRLDGGAAHRLPRVLGERDERGGGVGLPQPAQRLRGADAHRHLRAGQRLQEQRRHALRAHARPGRPSRCPG